MQELPGNPLDNQRKFFTQLNYILYIASVFSIVTGFIAIAINYSMFSEVKGSYLESHFYWQMNTFWIFLAGFVLTLILSFSIFGWMVYLGAFVVVIYRSFKGWLALSRGQALVG
jgi:uncharacterized membrane protein